MKEKLPDWQSNQHKDLVFFVILQRGRTPEAAAKTNELITKMLEAVALEGGPDLSRAAKDAGAMAGFTSTPELLLRLAETNLPAALDLRYKLVRNMTSHPFIISDHPVAAYNQFFEAHNPDFSDTGLQSRGLQLFFPLSPQYLLVLFDSEIYRIGGPIYKMVSVCATAPDVEALNILQVLNARESLFFNDAVDERYVRSIVAKAESCIKKEREKAEAFPAQQFGLPDGKMIVGHYVDPKIGLRLSFVRLEPSASKYRSRAGGHRLGNPELVDALTRYRRPRR